MSSSSTFHVNVAIPGYTILELLDETLDSINVLAQSNKTKKLFSIRIFNNDESSQGLIKQMIRWNKNIQEKDKDENGKIRSPQVNRFLKYEIFQDDSSEHYFACRTFVPRTIEFFCSFGDDLFNDEKHAICLQLAQIYKCLKNSDELYPIFPSRLVLHDDLFLQLTDFYDPNPIDEEAYKLGWFNPGATNKQFFIKIIKWIWHIKSNEASKRLKLYKNLDSNFLGWGALFIRAHRHSSDTSGLPPLISFDINRAKSLLNDAPCICYALTKMTNVIDGLTKQMIIERALSVALELMTIDIDIIQANVLLFVIKIIERIGFISSDQESRNLDLNRFTKFLDNVASSNHKSARFTLYCSLPHIVKLLPIADSKNLIVYLVISAEKHESFIFCTQFTETINSLKEIIPIEQFYELKSFVCQMIDLLKKNEFLSDPLLHSLASLNSSLYNVDTVLLSMPEQLLTVPSLRYLISVVRYASPPLRFRFNLMSILMPAQLCTLALKYIEILKEITPKTDFDALIPPNLMDITFQIPDAPTPKDLRKLELIKPLITSTVIQFKPSLPKQISIIPLSTHIVLHITNLKDFSLTFDGKYFAFCTGDSVKIYNSNLIFSFKFTEFEQVKLPKSTFVYSISTLNDKILFTAKEGNYYSLYEHIIGDTSRPKRIVNYTQEISFISSFEEALILFIIFCNGDVYYRKGNSLPYYFFNIPTDKYGTIISVITLPNTSRCIFGTNKGYIFLYDLRYRCPLRQTRPSNRPAYLAANDSHSFWVTCGPFVAKINVEMTKIILSISYLPTHIIRCCCVKGFLMLFHSDYSVHAMSENSLIDMNTMNNNLKCAKVDNNYINIEQHDTNHYHKENIIIAKGSHGTSSAVSYDESGRLVIWPNPGYAKYK